jgi:hypothetical protein
MNLKSKAGKGLDREFAYLIQPDGLVMNDEELYALVFKTGFAVVRPFEGGSLKLKAPVRMTPEEFEKKWQGD